MLAKRRLAAAAGGSLWAEARCALIDVNAQPVIFQSQRLPAQARSIVMLAIGALTARRIASMRQKRFTPISQTAATPPSLTATAFTQLEFAPLFMELRGGLERRRRLVAEAEGREIECPGPALSSALTSCALVSFGASPNGRVHLAGGSPARAMVGWPGSWQATLSGNRPGRSPATKAALGGQANRRAVMRVNPEQASKGKLWTPTQAKDGEGGAVWGSSRQTHPNRSTGVMGTARRDRGARKRGRPVLDGGSGLNSATGRWSSRESDRVVVPRKPGNSGGGKVPDFWCVFEADEVR